jgi:outer membrane immunogenic protein
MIPGKLIRTSIAALGALAAISVTQANAAEISSGGGLKDVPAPPPCCSFAGFYIGGNMGIAWSEAERGTGTFTFIDEVERLHSVNIGREKLNSTNGFGGGQFGYNFQSQCCWLYGIEVDLGALALNRNFHRFTPTTVLPPFGITGVSLDGDKNNDAFFAGDVTARVGYTWGTSLAYVKGGFAFVDAGTGLRENIFFINNTSATFGTLNNDNWLTGWTLGAGYEWKPCCQGRWSIKVEYLHYDFSNNKDNCCNDFLTTAFPGIINNRFRFDKDVTADTVKIGFNYFWNPPPAPLK